MIQLLIFLSNTGATNKQQFCIFSKDINHRHHHRPNHHHTIYDVYDVYTSYAFYNGDNDVCRDSHNMNNNAHANNYYDN